MSEIHTDGCTGVNHYSDGVFSVCYCKALVMNTFAGARFKHEPAPYGCKACVPEASHD